MERGNWPAHSAAPPPVHAAQHTASNPANPEREVAVLSREARNGWTLSELCTAHRRTRHARHGQTSLLGSSALGTESPARRHVREQVRECQTCVCLPCGFKPTRRSSRGDVAGGEMFMCV